MVPVNPDVVSAAAGAAGTGGIRPGTLDSGAGVSRYFHDEVSMNRRPAAGLVSVFIPRPPFPFLCRYPQ